MKKLYEGKVYDVLMGANAVVFPYLRAEMEDDQMAIFFKMAALENDNVSDAPKSVYFLTKFGTNYPPVVKYVGNYVEAKSLVLSNGNVFACNPDGTAALFDVNGEMVWNGVLKYKGKAPSSLAVAGDTLWGCFEELDSIIRFNIKTLREDLRIGGKGSVIKCPKSIFIEGDYAYLSLMKEKKVIRINFLTYEPEDYLYFDEPVFDFVKSGDKQYAVLESGFYRV